METTKIQKSFMDDGFGFPVVLQNVPMVYVRGVWTPDVNYNDLSLRVVMELVCSKSMITGDQMRFALNSLDMKPSELEKYLGSDHPAVAQWEGSCDNVMPMTWPVERDLRLFIMDRLGCTSEDIGELYERLRLVPRESPRCSTLVVLDMAR